MNKKLSLMLAAFVAAGWSLTAEAGVVKIANPSSGNSYVIAEKGLTDSKPSTAIQLQNLSAGVGSNAQSSGCAKGVLSLWKYGKTQNGIALYNAGNSTVGGGYLYTADEKKVALATNPLSAISYENSQILIGGKALKLGYGVDAELVSSGATELYFYAATNAINSNAGATPLEGRTIQIGDRYLVILADGSNKPALVTATEYGKIAAVAPANVVWTIGTDGVVSTANKNISGNKNIAISQSNGTLSFVWAASGTSIEINEAEGLAGFTDNGEFYQFLIDGSVKEITAGFTDADKKKFASVSHSENQYIQGWRMRFNSNSVKNSPDYVK